MPRHVRSLAAGERQVVVRMSEPTSPPIIIIINITLIVIIAIIIITIINIIVIIITSLMNLSGVASGG